MENVGSALFRESWGIAVAFGEVRVLKSNPKP